MTEPTHLTDLQFAIVRVLWNRGPSSVIDVQEALLPGRPLAQTTVATLLTRLEKRGVVTHGNSGRRYRYEALVTEDEVRRRMVSSLTDLLFAGRPAALIGHLVREAEIAPDDLDEVKRLIAAVDERGVGAGR